ncbi:MAG: UMP kinase, partial [Gemmataceae bacterium]|nr:UMP kinase [Gemmataceae bacterium]
MDDPSPNDPLKPKYKRVVLKLSGEGFGPSGGKSGISIDETINIAKQAKRVRDRGVQLAIVIGAGNLLRGAQFSAGGSVIKEGTAHYMGMLA